MQVRSVFVNSLHTSAYMSSPSYFATFPQPPYFYYSKVHVVGFLLSPTFCAKRGHQIAKLVAEYRTEEFSSAVVPYVALKEVAHGMVCLSESRRGLNFRDVICARRYWLVLNEMQTHSNCIRNKESRNSHVK